MQTRHAARWMRPGVTAFFVLVAVGALAMLNVAIDDVSERRERERALADRAVTTTAQVVSEEPSCTRVAVPARFGGGSRCRVRVEFDVPGRPHPVRTDVSGGDRLGEEVTVTYRADSPYWVVRGTNVRHRIAGEAYMGVVMSLAAFLGSVNLLRPLPIPRSVAEVRRCRTVIASPLFFAVALAPLAAVVGLAWGIALLIGLPLAASELSRWHDRLVIGMDEIQRRRWWSGTSRLVPDQRTTIEPGAPRHGRGALVLRTPDAAMVLVPATWADPARLADRLLRVLSAAGATIPPEVAAHLWAVRGGATPGPMGRPSSR
jgi:hypothetical protein